MKYNKQALFQIASGKASKEGLMFYKVNDNGKFLEVPHVLFRICNHAC